MEIIVVLAGNAGIIKLNDPDGSLYEKFVMVLKICQMVLLDLLFVLDIKKLQQ